AQRGGAHMVRCPKHGRVYDASKDPGCSKCIAEGTTPDAGGAPAADGARRLMPPWVLALVLLAVAGVIFGPKFLKKKAAAAAPAHPHAVAKLGAGGDDDISTGSPRSDRMDATPFQAPIQKLEAALYEEGERSPYSATRSVKTAAAALEDSIRAKHPAAPAPD